MQVVRMFQTTIMKILLAAAKRYSEMGLQHPFILVDTNHDNSGKQFEEQKYAS